MIKRKLIRRNKIASVGYVVIETKQSHYKRMQQTIAKELDWVGKVIY